MAKIRGLREKHHQPFWDCLIRGSADGGGNWEPRTPAQLGNTIRLFSQGGNGNLAITNMEGSGGQFPSDQTYRVLAMRVWLYFMMTSATEAPFLDDFIMYHRASTQLWWELVVASKTQFIAPTPYLPLGGGLFGDIGSDTRVYFNNGNPTQTSLMKLARSIALPARQNFYVQCTIQPMGNFNLADDIEHLTAGEVAITFFIDGLRVRDVL